MRIWQQHSLGDPMELLRLEEVDDPVVDPGKVLVEVEAVGLTFVDCLMARGMYQATTPIPWSPVGGDVFDGWPVPTSHGLGRALTGNRLH